VAVGFTRAPVNACSDTTGAAASVLANNHRAALTQTVLLDGYCMTREQLLNIANQDQLCDQQSRRGGPAWR